MNNVLRSSNATHTDWTERIEMYHKSEWKKREEKAAAWLWGQIRCGALMVVVAVVFYTFIV